jgi:8-oxo-dGTP pyrophosphatase MutT (NUDIX family)
MYRIYINQTVLIITESSPSNLDIQQEIDTQEFSFQLFYEKATGAAISGVYVLLTPEPRRWFKKIKRSFKIVKAGGGLVNNEENKYLFIFRNGKWDLPKGKVNEGEKVKKAAVREVEEECGITVNELGDRICKTWHTYEMDGWQILKRTSWYRMKALNQKKLVPQKEEGITRARWVAPGDFSKLESNTYPMIRDLINIAL